MGLDMYLSASKYNGGGHDYRRTDYIRPEDGNGPVRVVPKTELDDEVKQFDATIEALGLGTFEEFRTRYPEGNSLTFQVNLGYWRKANAIHAWFVTNCQGGRDECQETYVDRDQLTELRRACMRVLLTVDKGDPVVSTDAFGNEWEEYPNLTLEKAAALEELPPQQGFFFGDSELDQWYVDGLEYTVKLIDTVLNDPALEGWDFHYQSSW